MYHCSVVIAMLMAGSHFASAAETASRPTFTSQQRQRIDENAMWGPREKQNIAPVQVYGSALQWLISRTPMPLAEELERAARLHDQVCEVSICCRACRCRGSPGRAGQRTTTANAVPGYEFTITVVDQGETAAFTAGAGHIYVSQRLLQTTFDDVRRRSTTFDRRRTDGSRPGCVFVSARIGPLMSGARAVVVSAAVAV